MPVQLTMTVGDPFTNVKKGSQRKAKNETKRAHIGTPVLCHTLPSAFRPENHLQGLIVRVMPYRLREAMYKAVLDALRAENIMHPFNRLGNSFMLASTAAITMMACVPLVGADPYNCGRSISA